MDVAALGNTDLLLGERKWETLQVIALSNLPPRQATPNVTQNLRAFKKALTKINGKVRKSGIVYIDIKISM